MLHRAALILGIAALIAPAAHAGMLVNASDFIDSEFDFITPTSSDVAYQLKLASANESSSGSAFRPVYTAPTLFIYYNGASASSTLRWTFPTNSKPVQVTLTDRLTLFTNASINRTLATISYSTDGSTFHPIWSLTTPTDGSVVADAIQTNTVNFGAGITDFYYRVDMISLPGDANGVMDRVQDQWGRTTVGGSFPGFAATFSTVPTPGTAALLAAAGVVQVRRSRPSMQ
ncbi:MAG: hypothetical protein AAFX05_05265 [Planctomycetota bacterium]